MFIVTEYAALIKDKLIERTFNREGSPYVACNDRNAFFTTKNIKILYMVEMR